ncbi:MAG TPA: hypothetical protein VF940_14985 [Streptosporangiaceae bacterium]
MKYAPDKARLGKVSPPELGSARWLNKLLAADPGDTGRDLAFQGGPHPYADADLTDRDARRRFPGVAARLANCAPWQPDCQGLRGSHRPLSSRPFFRHIRVADADDLSPGSGSPNLGPFDINAQVFPISLCSG